MKWLLACVLLSACGPTKSVEATTAAPIADAAREEPTRAAPEAAPNAPDATAAAQAALERVLAAEAAGHPISTRVAPGPQGTHLVRAMIDDMPPGVGVRAAFVQGQVIVGPRDLAGFAAFVRAHEWLVRPPPTDELVTLANVALFDGLLALDDSVPSRLTTSADALTLELHVVRFPSGAKETVRVVVGSSGPAEVVATPPSTTLSAQAHPAAELEAALQRDDAAAISAAIGRLQRPGDPAALAALAKATLLPNETLAANALMAMGATPASATLLKAAWQALAPAARAKLVALARELYSDAFATSLE